MNHNIGGVALTHTLPRLHISLKHEGCWHAHELEVGRYCVAQAGVSNHVPFVKFMDVIRAQDQYILTSTRTLRNSSWNHSMPDLKLQALSH